MGVDGSYDNAGVVGTMEGGDRVVPSWHEMYKVECYHIGMNTESLEDWVKDLSMSCRSWKTNAE